MALFRLRRAAEEYTAGFEFCPRCGRTRRHHLQVRAWQLGLVGRSLEFGRRYYRRCAQCGYVERQPGPPEAEELAAWAAEEEQAASHERGELYTSLFRRMDYLLSPAGADERSALLAAAHPGVSGVLLEYARYRASELLRAMAASWDPLGVPPDPTALERALEQELFNACQAGYLAHAVAYYLQSGPPPPRRNAPPPDEFARVAVPRATGRAERARGAVDGDVAAWIAHLADQAPAGLAQRGETVPPRLGLQLAHTARACLYFGYALGAEELTLTR